MKVKQIYDRDTGNTYQIGGGNNEMKFVEKVIGCRVEQNWMNFDLSVKLEFNKMYLIIRYDYMNNLYTQTIYFNTPYFISETFIFVINDDDGELIPAHLHYVEGGKGINMLSISPINYPENFILSVDEENDYIEIYELPFALPNS